MISEFYLRKKMFNYMNKNYGALLNVLDSWNEKLNHGIPMAPELLADLFGHEINNTMVDEFIDAYDIPGTFIGVSVGAWMNEENPFQIVFVYKVETHTSTEDSVEMFTMGDESSLIEYCQERGYR
ncbi:MULTISPECIES: hypothetical protein [Bacillus cereus group]|uniref:hypothetical protein n=1 Tax=Bacillus cereus group TaxID=86661 RepID=UPI0022E96365|nr:hypothetical protein [Bacillus cereus group sp. BcHK140]MDA1918204.1 hypothetical protein [Bacillus cereus group sp. BcHK140]